MTGWLMQRVIVVNYLKKNGCGTANILRHFSSTQKCHGGDPSDIHPPTLDHGGEKCYYPHRDVTIGNREIVGFGINGKSIYQDDVHVPFPSIRFKERTNVKLLEKEKGDWKKLTIEEKKDLYRQTFGNTFAEINTPIHHQGADLGKGIWLTVGIIYGYILFYLWRKFIFLQNFKLVYPQQLVVYRVSKSQFRVVMGRADKCRVRVGFGF